MVNRYRPEELAEIQRVLDHQPPEELADPPGTFDPPAPLNAADAAEADRLFNILDGKGRRPRA